MSTHTIVSGDTFWNLAQKYGCTLESIIAANPGVIPEQLQIGQIVHLPESGIYYFYFSYCVFVLSLC
jgi:LysM repeat protein